MKLAVLALGFSLCSSLFAVSYTWDFTGSGGNGCTLNGSGQCTTSGNSLPFNITSPTGGPTIKATAWYVDASGNFQKAALGQYSHGLGVCYPGENCTNPDHQTDNNVLDEYVLFEFSSPVDPSSFFIQSTGGGGGTGNTIPGDLDASYWLGGTLAAQTLNLTGTTVSGLSGLGFGARNDNCSGAACTLTDTTTQAASRTVDITGGIPTGYVNKVLFGAKYLDNNDYFKITSLTGATGGAVPEPSSVILLATIGLVLFRLKSKLVVRPQNN